VDEICFVCGIVGLSDVKVSFANSPALNKWSYTSPNPPPSVSSSKRTVRIQGKYGRTIELEIQSGWRISGSALIQRFFSLFVYEILYFRTAENYLLSLSLVSSKNSNSFPNSKIILMIIFYKNEFLNGKRMHSLLLKLKFFFPSSLRTIIMLIIF
jgi:hypothetical protein